MEASNPLFTFALLARHRQSANHSSACSGVAILKVRGGEIQRKVKGALAGESRDESHRMARFRRRLQPATTCSVKLLFALTVEPTLSLPEGKFEDLC